MVAFHCHGRFIQYLYSVAIMCINLVWKLSHNGHAWSQTIKTNVIGTLNMLGLAKRVGARLVLINTCLWIFLETRILCYFFFLCQFLYRFLPNSLNNRSLFCSEFCWPQPLKFMVILLSILKKRNTGVMLTLLVSTASEIEFQLKFYYLQYFAK